jgi:hypothetical protein
VIAAATAAMLAVAPYGVAQGAVEVVLPYVQGSSAHDLGYNLVWFGGLAWSVLLVLVHIAFAIGVWRHASRAAPLFVPAPWWGLATLLGGPFTAAASWLMHLSTLAPPAESARSAATRPAATRSAAWPRPASPGSAAPPAGPAVPPATPGGAPPAGPAPTPPRES